MTDEARELELYVMNDKPSYDHFLACVKNARRRMEKKEYHSRLAIRLFLYVADAAALRYTREHCEHTAVWYRVFPKAARIEAAEAIRDQFEEENALGNYDTWSQ